MHKEFLMGNEAIALMSKGGVRMNINKFTQKSLQAVLIFLYSFTSAF